MERKAVSADVELLLDGCARVETPPELRARLKLGRPLRVKFGVDPTGSELHLGHAVVLHKMQQFVEAGHAVTLLIGDFTALIGDPSGRNDSRPHLTSEEIAENMRTYTTQAATVLDLERVTVRYNSEWLATIDMAHVMRLLAQTTVAQMLSREDFRNRYVSETPIALHEFLYPVAQAYDSVALECDVELGGDDQLFNFLLARTYQANAGQLSQICMTMPILEGTDGVIRMGKSKGNYIGLTEPPNDQFGKTMSIPDELIARWARLADFRSQADSDAIKRGIADGSRSPLGEKKWLAESIVRRYHGPQAARDARTYFERTIQRKERPDAVPEMPLGPCKKVADVIVAAKFAESKRAAQRLIVEGAVRIDGVVVNDAAAVWPAAKAAMLQVGSRRFIRVVPNEITVPSVAVDTGKPVTGEAVDAGKLVTGEAVDTGKLVTGEAVDAAKLATGEAVDTGKLVAGEAVEMTNPVAGVAVEMTNPVAGVAVETTNPVSSVAVDGTNPVAGVAFDTANPVSSVPVVPPEPGLPLAPNVPDERVRAEPVVRAELHELDER